MKNGKNGSNGKDRKCAYIDGVAHEIKSNHTSVLKFVREHVGKDKIPSLCDDPNLAPYGACRVCSVDVALKKDGPTKTVASCHTPVTEGSYILTKKEDLVYGQSITDACLSWEDTEGCLASLSEAILKRNSK